MDASWRSRSAALVWIGLSVTTLVIGWASRARAETPVLTLDAQQTELLSVLSRQWVLIETPHVRLFAAEPDRVHPVALRHLETFVQDTLDALGADAAVRLGLDRDPIRYFLCAHPQEVQLLGGARSEGVSLLERRAIVSRWLPHDHEVVHMLAYESVAGGPALVPPLLQEGLASAWGGQRGLAKEVVLDRGEQGLREARVDLTRLWEYDEFHALSRDLSIAYAVGARFVQYLLDVYGIEPFLRLYRLVAGEPDEVRARPASANILQLEEVYDVRWPVVLEGFAAWRQRHPTGFGEFAAAPARAADLQAQHEGRYLSVWNDPDGSMVLLLEGMRGAPEGLVTWGPRLPSTYRTRLYTGRLQAPLPRYGLRITADTVELYDYGMDQIMAELRPPVPMDSLAADATRRITVRLNSRALASVERPDDVQLTTYPRVEY